MRRAVGPDRRGRMDVEGDGVDGDEDDEEEAFFFRCRISSIRDRFSMSCTTALKTPVLAIIHPAFLSPSEPGDLFSFPSPSSSMISIPNSPPSPGMIKPSGTLTPFNPSLTRSKSREERLLC